MSNKKSISNSFSVSTIEDGAQGKRGRFYYYKGDWDDFALNAEFPVSDSQMPFFKVVRDGQTRYYVFNPEQNKIYTKAEMGEPSNNAPWELMTNDFKYLITEAIFSNFAQFGSAIISGDWMISQHGVIYDINDGEHQIFSSESSGEGTWTDGGVTYNTNNSFLFFDSNYPNESKPNAINFVPNYSLDLKRGVVYQNISEVKGVFKSSGANGSSTRLSAARLHFGYANEDIFEISCEGSGSNRNVKLTIGAADFGMTFFNIESRGTFQGQTTSLIKLVNLESGINVPSIVIHKGGIAMTYVDGTIIKQKSWDELLS